MTITKEGALASFYTVNKAPIKHLRVYFSPKQAGSGTASPENVREISGWNNINITQIGKNLFNINTMTNRPGVTISGNTFIGSAQDIRYYHDNSTESVPIFIPAGTTFIVHCTAYSEANVSTEGAGLNPWFVYKDGTAVRPWYTKNSATSPTYYSGTITATQDIVRYYWGWYNYSGNIWHISDLQFEISSVASKYEPCINSTHTIDWSNDIGTIYGGYVDLITGELIETNKKLILDGSSDENWWAYDTYDQYKGFALDNSGLKSGTRQAGYANWLPIVSTATANNLECWLGVNNTRIYCTSTASLISTYSTSTWRDYLNENPLEIVIPLATPIVHQLSSQQLQTFIGRNNIWSNADRIEVEYDLAESNDELYRRRNILLNTPHIETIDNNIAVFNTDMIAPIKEAKVYFNCRKENGTPSLTSPKQVLSRTNMEVYSYGENLFNINTDVVGSRYVDYTTGNLITWGNSWNASTFIAIEPNTVYTLRCSNSGLSVAGFAFYDSTQTYISGIRNNHSSSVPTATTTFTTPSNAAYIRFTFVEPLNYLTVLVKGESIPNLNTYSVDWSEIGELYGGYVDLVNGNLYKTYNRRNLKDYRFGYYTSYQYYLTCSDRKKTSTNLYTNLFPISTTNGYPQVNYSLGYYSNGASYADIIFIRYEDAGEGSHTSEFNTWLQGLENDPYVVYEMAEPEYIATLTPHSLKSLRGKNIMQGNGRGPVSIKYWTH